MSGEYVRGYYHVPARCGDPVTIDGRHGVITGFDNQYLLVRSTGGPTLFRLTQHGALST